MKSKPNPGTTEAMDLGCRCPVIDNHYGKGILIKGKREFWYSGECDIHGEEFNKPKKDENS